jgi:hypothetical protein
MRSESVGNEQFLEHDNEADEIQKRNRDKMISIYGKEGWRKKQEEDLKRVQAKLKEKESSKVKTVPRTEKKPPINTKPYVETNTTDKTQMRASEEEKKQAVGMKEDSNKLDVADDEVIESDSESEKKELKPVEYKGNYLGGEKAIKDKIFNRSRGSKSLQNATTLLFYLIQHSAWEGKNDKHHTYKSWYAKKRLIVASRSQEQMSLDLGVSVSTIKRWLDDLERDKLIERAIEGRENVYILGKVLGDTEFYFYEKNRAQN